MPGLREMAGVSRSAIFFNLLNSNRNQIIFTIFQMNWIQTDVRLDPNQSENGKYNPISV